MEVSKVLQPWVQFLEDGSEKTVLKKTAWIVLKSKVIVIMIRVFVVLISVPIFQKGNIIEASGNIISFSAVCSCMGGFAFFSKNGASIARALSQIILVAEEIRKVSDDTSKDIVTKAAASADKIIRVARLYGAFLVLAVVIPPCIRGKLEWEMHWLYLDDYVGIITAVAYQVSVALPLGAAWQGFFSLCIGVNLCCASLFTAIGRCLSESSDRGVRGERTLRDLVAMYANLCGATRNVNDLFAPNQLPFLFGILMVPGLTTYIVIKGTPHYFSLTALPAIFLIFLPLCLAGQHLEDESTRVGADAFNGPWMESTAYTRKLYLTVMASASRPQTVRMEAFGSLNHSAFQSTLRSWFSYVNMLLKADSR